MKKQLFSIIGICLTLAAACVFNFVKNHKKVQYCVVSKSCFGINLDTTSLDTKGANWVIIDLHKKGECVIGNLKDTTCTWYMNK